MCVMRRTGVCWRIASSRDYAAAAAEPEAGWWWWATGTGRFQDRRIVAKADHMIRLVRIVERGSDVVGGDVVAVSGLLLLLEYFCTWLKDSAWPAEAVANALPI